jgi:hypothetical protein
MNLAKTQADFHHDTRAAMDRIVADSQRTTPRWYLHAYAAVLFQVVGFACALLSFQLAGAIAVTSVLFTVYCGFGMAYRTRRYGKLPELREFPEDFRFLAAMAWRRRAIGLRLMTVSFANLCAGMGFITLIHFFQGVNVGTTPMGWLIILSTFIHVALRQRYTPTFLVGPLLKGLDTPVTPEGFSQG